MGNVTSYDPANDLNYSTAYRHVKILPDFLFIGFEHGVASCESKANKC
jgi:hypothetical protein